MFRNDCWLRPEAAEPLSAYGLELTYAYRQFSATEDDGDRTTATS